ncbi:phage tail assembly protein [Amycolatopsis cihanbeyliensis]|uniref:phage tail assembly protein n=1 Tax=Amycolatopsis cihanbeyliensis TaxID=1128664 RepID=UPI00114F2FF8|nr:phage tail assembly protein [Amycolatopsis cihanbeyliensis]
MSNTYSLETLKADLDQEFAPLRLTVDGEELVLQNLLRIGEKDRAAVMAALKEVEATNAGEDENRSLEEVETLTSALELILRTVTAKGKGDKLVASFEGDLMLAMKVLDLWAEATQPGEAQNSPA